MLAVSGLSLGQASTPPCQHHAARQRAEKGLGAKLKPAASGVQAAKFYPADDVKTPLKRRTVAKPARLRASIQPGTVLILLAGHFKGKRVIFLKQLESGLLLVTGPFKVNGVRSPFYSTVCLMFYYYALEDREDRELWAQKALEVGAPACTHSQFFHGPQYRALSVLNRGQCTMLGDVVA